MRLELNRPIIFFDLETTGTNVQTDRIVELAAIKLWPDGRREEKSRRFNPLMPIPKEASQIHGITDQDVKNEPPFGKVVRGERGILAFFSGCDLAGFNIIGFDIPMLQQELQRAGEVLDLSEVAVVDAYRIFVQQEPRHLSAALAFYCGKSHEQAHSALGDVQATLEVFEAQLERYDDLPNTTDEIDRFVRHPDNVDRRGKLKWVDGEVTVSFGRHKGKTLRYLASEEPDYLHWMIENDIATDGVKFLRDALIGHFPQLPKTTGATKAKDESSGSS